MFYVPDNPTGQCFASSNILIATIGAGAAIVGGAISGGLQRFYDWHHRPKLRLDYEGKEGANRVVIDDISGRPTAGVYVRARVWNEGKNVAKNCRVFLTALTEVQTSGTTPTSFCDATPLSWPGGEDFLPRDLPNGVEFYVDVTHVSKHVSGWLFSVEQLFGDPATLKDYKGTYRFKLTATADGADPATTQVDVTYNGDWHSLRAVPAKQA